MSKKIKMVLYGEPGVGKSVFACKAPKPFFICTDGNYEWLEDFGAKEEDHINVESWADMKKALAQNYDEYETIVIDLLEDGFKWCEKEFCVRNKIDHVSDIGYGKGYDITRNEFFIEISKLLAKDKHIILIMHGLSTVEKDRRGVEHTKYIPSPRLPDKVIDMIEGRVRYFLRAYLKAEESDNNVLIKKRYLSLVPKENEFGIIRGIDENTVPHDIPLDFNEFAKYIGLAKEKVEDKPVKQKAVKKEVVKEIEVPAVEKAVEKVVESLQVVEEVKEEPVEVKEEPIKVKEEPKPVEIVKPIQPQSNEDKIAAIKAKLAGFKKQ